MIIHQIIDRGADDFADFHVVDGVSSGHDMTTAFFFTVPGPKDEEKILADYGMMLWGNQNGSMLMPI